jgi:YtcA-like protein
MRVTVPLIAGALVSGCTAGPDVTVAGSYFPSWMLAMVVGVLGTMLCWQLFTRIGIDPYLGPRPLVYASLVLIITLVLWLGVFRG